MSNSVSPLHIDFSSVKRKLAEIKDMIFPPFESTVDHQGRKHCLQCYTVLPSGSNDDFCSQQCVLSYWDEFRQQYNGYSGRTPVCNLPGCMEPCYVENHGRTHDYCKRSHAQQHRKMQEAAQRQLRSRGKKNSGNQWGNGQKAGRGGGQHHGVRNPQGAHVGAGYGHSGAAWNPNGPVYFYNRNEPYYEFTNFYRGAPILLDGCEWPTSEHYFQAQKFVGTPYVERIRNASGPREAFDISRDPQASKWIRSDWEEVKIDVMRKALFAKFTRSKYLRDRLLETGDRELVERSPYDSFWGDGGNGTGRNWLGRLLMELRTKLRGKRTEDDIQRDGGHSGSTPSYVSQASGPPASDSGSEVRGSSPSSSNMQQMPLQRSKSSGDGEGRFPSSCELQRQPLHKSKSSEEPMEITQSREVRTEMLVNVGDDSFKECQQHVNDLKFMASPATSTDSKNVETDSNKELASSNSQEDMDFEAS